ncbi:unnamed protein product [Adineta steineri]|uniref:NAD(P)(+)--arginine ADP-ribosyltransferase n=1 Tax=Adineta steineri TaxID=433720 RepID=A0A818Z093_9BILA|nr:unnamed protein product [Adineta steineri]CAF3763816.1 unnamed protein product [Adineta steineri]
MGTPVSKPKSIKNRFSDIDLILKRLPAVFGYHSEEIVSIEKALESIESQISELKVYIKTAKKYCHFPSEDGLTRDESAAVYIYTMEWGKTSLYRLLNKALRDDNRQNIIIWFPYLKLFDTALDKLPTVKDSVWRGISLDIGKNFTKDQLLTWWTVNSCSSSVNVIKNFLGNNKSSTLFLIQTINGKKISGYTAYEGEDEVILKIGTQFRVKSDPLEQSNQSHVVHLMEIDDDDELLAASKPQEFAAPGTCEELDCKGRPCAKCHRCRDWHFTGDQDKWNWFCNYENWQDVDYNRWRNGAYELFTKRVDATCGRNDDCFNCRDNFGLHPMFNPLPVFNTGVAFIDESNRRNHEFRLNRSLIYNSIIHVCRCEKH